MVVKGHVGWLMIWSSRQWSAVGSISATAATCGCRVLIPWRGCHELEGEKVEEGVSLAAEAVQGAALALER
eukprot:230695-Chlamydomonas_euryale.AAC.1